VFITWTSTTEFLINMLKAKNKFIAGKYIIGVDEVGRGPLAGPVTVAAVALPRNLKLIDYSPRLKLRDSKKLTQKQREIWAGFIKSQPKIKFAIASVSPKVLDRINISQAANLAATRAVARLMADSKWRMADCRVLLDGGLYLKNTKHKTQNTKTEFKVQNVQTVVKGDEKFPAIMMASIMAKVRRDRYMKKMHKFYPVYGFDVHKGYGTRLHRDAIKKFGLSEIHRRSFTLWPALPKARRIFSARRQAGVRHLQICPLSEKHFLE